MKVLVYSAQSYDRLHFESYQKNIQFEYVEAALTIETVHLAKDAFAVCIFVNDDASEPVLQQLAMFGVKGIAIRAAGHDQADHVAAHRLGIHVANVPSYSPHAIAEHTVTMILALARHIVEADARIKKYNFELGPLVGFNLHHKKVGIIGVGKIGGITAKILNGFGCVLTGFDPVPDTSYTDLYGLRYVSLEEVLHTSDIIVIQAPLNAHTKYLINQDSINSMKAGVMIINTGRGGIIHTTDAIQGLRSGKIGYLGIDVYENERGLFFTDHSKEIPADNVFAELMTYKNVLITGHMAFLTANALSNIAQITVENISAWQLGNNSANEL